MERKFNKPDLNIINAETQVDMKRLLGARSICLDAGEDFDKLPETYVIFITETDIYKKGLPFYNKEGTKKC